MKNAAKMKMKIKMKIIIKLKIKKINEIWWQHNQMHKDIKSNLYDRKEKYTNVDRGYISALNRIDVKVWKGVI